MQAQSETPIESPVIFQANFMRRDGQAAETDAAPYPIGAKCRFKYKVSEEDVRDDGEAIGRAA